VSVYISARLKFMQITTTTENLIEAFKASLAKGASFVSFIYQTKSTGETSIYTLNFGIKYKNAVSSDFEALCNYVPKTPLEEEAKAEMLQSMNETLTQGVSSAYTQKDLWETIIPGVRLNKESGQISFYGFIQKKEIIEPATNPRKTVNSKPLTLAKKAVQKACDFKCNRFAQFVITTENLAGVKVRGELIEIQD